MRQGVHREQGFDHRADGRPQLPRPVSTPWGRPPGEGVLIGGDVGGIHDALARHSAPMRVNPLALPVDLHLFSGVPDIQATAPVWSWVGIVDTPKRGWIDNQPSEVKTNDPATG